MTVLKFINIYGLLRSF